VSLLDLIMAAEAAQVQAAIRRTAYRHQHLADKPLVVVAYNLSGEAAAPLGLMYGVDADLSAATLVVAAEPRNRDSRFGAINAFAAHLVEFVDPYRELKTVPTRTGGFRQVASDAPQIVVPNRATRAFLGARLGRSLRYLGLGDTHEVPEATQWTGAHLSWFAEHSHLPGQSTFLAMTESLSHHFVTGQSALEDENLATLLAWIDGVKGELLPALEVLEEGAYGPVPNPAWEAKLEPYVKAYSQGLRAEDPEKARLAFEHVEREVRDALSVAYAATHRAIKIFRGLQPAASVPDRWRTDVSEWSDHARRCTKGIPMFARRHDALRAARTLQRWTSAAEALEIDQAFDDPMVMARLDADGRCVTGTVTSIDSDNREIKPGGRNRTRVPLIDVSLTAPTRLLAGEVVRWTGDRKVKGVLRRVDTASALVAITSGIKAFDDACLATGVEAMFAGLDPWEGMDPWTPDEVPWTHREPTTSELAGDDVGDTTAAVDDDSPDLTLAELGEIPIVGTVGPENEPGVVL
jgi:hypothetical protein